MNRTVSVVIRSYTRSSEIFDLLKALAGQRPKPHEIVIIDSGSDAWIVERLRVLGEHGLEIEPPSRPERPSTADRIPVALIEIDPAEYQSARALNWAIDKAGGELVAILSQDAVPVDGGYLQRLASGFDDSSVAGAYGRQILPGRYDAVGEKDLFRTYPPRSRLQRAPDCWFVNTCSMVRRDLWSSQKFDERAEISEDHQWAKQIQERGYSIKYQADAIVYHYHYYDGARKLWNRFFQEGRGLFHVHGRQMKLLQTIHSATREIASDAFWLVRRGHPLAWPGAVYRRAIKYVALYCGNRRSADRKGVT